jgi:hypothetical protein
MLAFFRESDAKIMTSVADLDLEDEGFLAKKTKPEDSLKGPQDRDGNREGRGGFGDRGRGGNRGGRGGFGGNRGGL